VRALLQEIPSPLAHVAAWLAARQPHELPRLVFAGLIVAAGWAAGRFGARLIASLIQLALLAAAVVVAYDILRM